MSIHTPSPSRIWREFHWAFFVNVQGLVLCLRRFNMLMHEGNNPEADKELRAAAVLLRASASSMELAASFSKTEYENTIRVSMTPPSVESDDFSGLMSFDHAVLIQVWRQMKDVFATLPVELHDAHSEFVAAYKHLAEGHVGVCSRFVGSDAGSLRYGDRKAIDTLKRFESGRLSMIDPPKKGCPFHK